MNLVLCCAGLLMVPLAIFSFRGGIWNLSESVLILGTGSLLCLQNFRIFAAAANIIFHRPFVVFDEEGLRIFGGPFDHWKLKWPEIEVFTPELETLANRLKNSQQSGENKIIPPGFLNFSVKVPALTAKSTFSHCQHSQFPEIIEFYGSFLPLAPSIQTDLLDLLRDKVRKFDSFLISDSN